jgi:hypothetical protein
MDLLRELDGKIRQLAGATGGLTGCGLDLRSCGCRLVSLSFEGLSQDSWAKIAPGAQEIIDNAKIAWDLAYTGFFPGTEMVKRVIFRHLCNHCRENYRLDGAMGMGSVVFADRT